MKRIRYTLLLMLLASVNVAFAQEAFYIYRNDGDFNGFFFNEVQHIGVSKTDLQGIEHEEYVVQEVQTADSLYRIPLAAIDSVGFQQPEIIMNERFFSLDNRYKDPDNFPYDLYEEAGISHLDPWTIHWKCTYDFDGKGGVIYHNNNLPRVGDVLYSHIWCLGEFNPEYGRYEGGIDGPFVGKVVEVKPDPDYDNDGWRWVIVCEPIENIGDVFEQLITVEQLGTDGSGSMRQRIAGIDKVRKRVEGNKEMTIINLNGRFPVSRDYGDLNVSLGLDLTLAVKANMTYKLTRKEFFVKVKFEEDATVGADFTLKGNLHETTTWQIAKIPIYVPSFLPLFEINPAPGAFCKTAGDISMKISSPQFTFHADQSVIITGDGVSGGSSKTFKSGDNGWGLEVSLNGSVHTGMHFPFNIETNNWAKKIAWCSTGVDLYVGPKFSASFTLDPVALASGQNVYPVLKNTQVKFSTATLALEGTAKFSAAGKEEKTYKIFEGEGSLGEMSLNVFPYFDNTDVQVEDITLSRQVPAQQAVTTIYPRGNSLPWRVGAAVYDAKDNRMISKWYDYDNGKYSAFNTFKEAKGPLTLYDGEYKIVPILEVLGYDVPVWERAETVKAKLGGYAEMSYKNGFLINELGSYVSTKQGYNEGYIMVYGLMPGDEVFSPDFGEINIVTPGSSGVTSVDGNMGFTVYRDGDPEVDPSDGNLRVQKFIWKYSPRQVPGSTTYFAGTQQMKFTIYRANGTTCEFDLTGLPDVTGQ